MHLPLYNRFNRLVHLFDTIYTCINNLNENGRHSQKQLKNN